MAALAQSFLGARRVVWLHGRRGVGKSALAAEFCRFYSMPGDRIFSLSHPSGDEGGARLIRLAGLGAEEATARLREALSNASLETDHSRRWLVALDGVDELLDIPPESNAGGSSAIASFWHCLADALTASQHLRVLLTSQRPLYGAPLPCKVVAYELPPLAREDAALLLARRAHRPLYARDLDAAAAAANAPAGEPLALSGRQREFAQQLAAHPLLTAAGGAPSQIIAAAAKVTPQLPTLFAHPLLKDSAASSSTCGISHGGGRAGGAGSAPVGMAGSALSAEAA